MAKLIRFPTRGVHWTAAYVLELRALCASPASRTPTPERLGNMLQALARTHPAVVLVLESLVAEIIAMLDRSPIG